MLRALSIHGVLAASLTLCFAGCGDDAAGDPLLGGPGPSYAGSCNFPENEAQGPSAARCDDYADAQANANSQSACTSSGGVWSATQCPIPMRFAVCTWNPPVTRTYAYTVEAATALESTCPMGKLMPIEQPEAGEGGEGGMGGSGGAAGTMGGMGGTGGIAGGDEDAGL